MIRLAGSWSAEFGLTFPFIDLATVEKRIKKGYYITREMLVSDLQLMMDNCRTYNPEASEYYEIANKLEAKYLKPLKIQLYGPAVDF